MNKVSTAMRSILKKCSISVNGNIFSKEKLMRKYATFLSQTMEKRKHNVGIILHSGSVCFDALIITYAAISNLLFNQTKTDDIIGSLEEGDMVLYGIKKTERYLYQGMIDGAELSYDYKGVPYIKLSQESGGITYVPESNWRLIEPYYGKSTKLDGTGIKKKGTLREEFLTEILEIPASDISNVVDTSTVLIMQKEEADQLIKGISITFHDRDGNDKEIRLLDLITASYYTEDEEHSYGGNIGKTEPVLKICAKVSVARRLVVTRDGNRHAGLIVMGQELISRGETELPELINRQSLQYVYLCSNVTSAYMDLLLSENDNINVFACTKAFLTENASSRIEVANALTDELKKQTDAIALQEHETVIFENVELDMESYKRFKEMLLKIKRDPYESETKANFISQSYSLFNLLMSTPFSSKDLQRCIDKGFVQVGSMEEKRDRIEQLADEMGETFREEKDYILGVLNDLMSAADQTPPKGVWLFDYLQENTRKRIAIVVPKAYYATVIKDQDWFTSDYNKRVFFMTPGRFDNTKLYHVIIVLGDYEGKKFNAFNCNAAQTIISLLYESEERKFRYKKRKALKLTQKWNRRSTLGLKQYIEEDFEEDDQVEELLDEDMEIENYVSQLDTVFDSVGLYSYSQGTRINAMTEIVAIATFTDESKAFFSKNYKAYVLDSERGTVSEEGVSELNEGDSIIFTKNNNDTKDIVDSILKQTIIERKQNEQLIDLYNKSKEWKQSLIDYMLEHDYTPRQVADNMIALEAPVKEPTIIRWLDEDSHTVGPKKIESLRAIGTLTGNEELEMNPEMFHEACSEIRKIRMRILGEIGKAIINKFSGAAISDNNEFAEVYEKVDSIAEVLQIERIVPADKILPLNIANRPING